MQRTQKSICSKAIKLHKYFENCKSENSEKAISEIRTKFKTVWGDSMAEHFLSKYDDADSLIWALDSKNLDLFLEKF